MPKFWIFGNSSGIQNSLNEETISKEIPIQKDKRVFVDSPYPAGATDATSVIRDFTFAAPLKKDSEQNDHFPTSSFFGVSLPTGVFSDEFDGQPLVFEDKKEALCAVKKYKGARFKAFAKRDDAVQFASQPAEQISQSPSRVSVPFSPPVSDYDKNQGGTCTVLGEKGSQYKGPKSQDTVKLRKCIENGDIDSVCWTVWSNPRYLISSGDTPTILQEGFRYNALHVATKFKQPGICKFIMDTIKDPLFMELLYEDDSESVRLQRIRYLADSYLNTPDKRLCETPLHFASKFGCLNAVEILVSHPECDKSRRNKYGLQAKEIICERCPTCSIELKKQIEDAFEGQFFVPVIRAEDDCSQPVIGEPCFNECLNKFPQCLPKSSTKKSSKSQLPIRALAGPMSPKQAAMFYKHWKTPPASRYDIKEAKQLSQIRLCDREKGLERIGRTLAHNWKTNWMEYWPILKTWCDLSSEDGLEKLESHLQNMYCKLHQVTQKETVNNLCKEFMEMMKAEKVDNSGSSELCVTEEIHVPCEESLNCSSSNSSGGISELCRGLDELHFSDSDSSLMCSPEMPNLSMSGDNFMYNKCDTPQFCNPDLKYSTPIVRYADSKVGASRLKADADKCSRTSSHDLYDEKNGNSKSDECKNNNQSVFSHANRVNTDDKFLSVVTSIVKCLMDFLFELAENFESRASAKESIHSLLKEDVVPIMKYLTDMNFNDEPDINYIHCDIARETCEQIEHSLTQHEILMVLRCLHSYLEQRIDYGSSDEEEEIGCQNDVRFNYSRFKISDRIQWQHLKCILYFLCSILNQKNPIDDNSCHCQWQQISDAQNHFTASVCRRNMFNMRKEASCPQLEDSLCNPTIACDTKVAEEENFDFFTPPSSPESSSSEDEPVTPDEGLEVYVQGKELTKADLDMLRAISDAELDPVNFPHICRWKHLIESKNQQKATQSYLSPVESNHIRNFEDDFLRIHHTASPELCNGSKQTCHQTTPLSSKTASQLHYSSKQHLPPSQLFQD